MLECTADDIYEALDKAPNVNAAIKNFLKREGKKGDPSERFAKGLRQVFSTNNEVLRKKFINDTMPQHLNYFYSVACYAYFEFVSKLAENIVNQYADDFNNTFEIVENKLNFKDRAKFDAISAQALDMMDAELKELNFSGSQFMRNVALISVFEQPVIEILAPKFQ